MSTTVGGVESRAWHAEQRRQGGIGEAPLVGRSVARFSPPVEGDVDPANRVIILFTSVQGLRSPSEPLQRWQNSRTTSATEVALEFVNAEAAVMTFPLQHTKCDETTEDMMPLGPL